MLNSVFLDVAIGLAFLFCLVSLAASAVREMIEGVLKTRGVMLERGIRELIGEGATLATTSTDGLLTKALYENPQVAGLYAGGYPAKLVGYIRSSGVFLFMRSWLSQSRVGLFTNLPSYIPSRNFANAVLDHIVRGAVDPNTLLTDTAKMDIATVRRQVAALPNAQLQRAVLTALDEAGDDIDLLRTKIERWYDSGMDRVSGWYKRETQMILFAIGLIFAIALNINAIAIGQRLLVDTDWRNTLVQSIDTTSLGNSVSATGTPAPVDPAEAARAAKARMDTLEKQLNDNGFMIGAPLRDDKGQVIPPPGGEGFKFGTWLMALLAALPGYLILAFATTLGAPFWFDLLNRLMVVRSTVKPHEKSQEEASKDGASNPPPPPPPPPLSPDANGENGGNPPPPPPPPPADPTPPALLSDDQLIDPADRPREDDPTDETQEVAA